MLFKDFASRRPALSAFIAVFLFAIIQSVFIGRFGKIGPDPDDAMRLAQIRDLLNGQSWFDLHQYRMGPEGGTLMHWSRLADAPIALMIKFFDLFLPYKTAESIALTLYPPLTAGLVIWGIAVGMRHIGGRLTLIFGMISAVILLAGHFRFGPGSIDHHNLQLGFLAIAIGFILDPDHKKRSAIIAAVGIALMLAIGIETLFMAAALCLSAALIWLFKPTDAREGTKAFGITLSAFLIAILVLTVSPAHYSLMSCDNFSALMPLAGTAGGIGLAAAAHLTSEKSFAVRLGSLILIGIVCAVLLLTAAPQCLSDPLASLPPEVKTLWLDEVTEARPLFRKDADMWTVIPAAIGPVLLALGVCALQMRETHNRFQPMVLALILVLCLALTVHQIRFFVFGSLACVFVLGPWVARVYEKTRSVSANSPLYILALAVSTPYVWALPGTLFTNTDAETQDALDASDRCYSENVMDALNTLDPGLVILTSNGTSHIVLETRHRALSGNYHRNVAGIQDNIRIFTSEPETSRTLLKKHKADYLHFCTTTNETAVLAKYNKNGLAARMTDGEIPEWLEPLALGSEPGAVTLYRVK